MKVRSVLEWALRNVPGAASMQQCRQPRHGAPDKVHYA
jgi:hypothetical protein